MFRLITPAAPVELTQYLEADFKNEAIRREVTQKMLSEVLSSPISEIILRHNVFIGSNALEVTMHDLVKPVPTAFYFKNFHGLGQLFLTLDAENPIDPNNFGTPKETFTEYYGFNSAIILQAGIDDPSKKFATVVASAINPLDPVEPDVYIGAY